MFVHFIGIGGIGMSALARYFKSQHWVVSGSDLHSSRLTAKLQKEGMGVKIGHKKGNVTKNIDLVVYNRAILVNNPELVAAMALKLKILPYAEVLGNITKKYKTLAITGSHGKSTTTALTGLILAHAGLDPTIFVGTELKEFGGKNIRIGKGPCMVLEADDFGKAFLHYSPTVALITNIDREHFDTYPTLKSAQKAFLQFLARTKKNGVFVLNKDAKNLYSLIVAVARISKIRRIKVIWYSVHDAAARKIKKVISISGEHNLSNALGAYCVARALMIPESKILSSISKYRGASRRMEYRGKYHVSGVTYQVFDDYAHHPTEIQATLQAFKEKYPNKKIVCVFQPHQARRLEALFREFQSAFDLADEVLILPIYTVAGRDEKTWFDSKALVQAIQKKQPKKLFFYLEKPKNLKKALNTLLYSPTFPRKSVLTRLNFQGKLRRVNQRKSTVLVMMGAGDIVKYTDQLLKVNKK